MRKNKFFMLGIITVFVAILSLTFVSSTFARYTSTVSGTDTAKIAKWHFSYDSSEAAAIDRVNLDSPQSVDFDLFNTIKDTDGVNNETDVRVDPETSQLYLAPGTSGSFSFVVENKSDVNAAYTVTFDSQLLNYSDYLPLNFTVTRIRTVDTVAQPEEVLGTFKSLATFNSLLADLAIDMDDEVEYIIDWEWPIDGFDVDDTKLGYTQDDTHKIKYQVNLDILFYQVD